MKQFDWKPGQKFAYSLRWHLDEKKVVDGAARAIQTFECWRREKKFFLAERTRIERHG